MPVLVFLCISMGGNDGILDPGDDQLWTQASLFIDGTVSSGDQFGWSLAVGDFDDDGKYDLAIGVPGDVVDGLDNAGSVNVIYGGSDGLGATGNQLWNQNTSGIGGVAEVDDQFGYSLEVADFNFDGVDDLAIGIPYEDIGSEEDAGAVQIIYGEADEGLVSTGSLFISQDEPGFLGLSEAGDLFGFSLASGRLNNDNHYDLSIGAPSEDFDDATNAGAVYVVHGSSGGLQFNDEYSISESNLSVPGGRRANRRFGYAQTSSDFDNDNKHDLAINAWPPFQSSDNVSAVIVAYRVNHDFIFSDGFE
ncbi:FG-GAP repeat protein [Marinicella sediminis]|uniref:FG-GAP repeat protein n=2 Tax=Marinicella sediminis TaxID=1792834 RepID=A0ABV7JIM9_9GAMM